MAENAGVKKLVVIGGSAGSLEVIFELLPKLLPHPHTAYIVIIHRKADPDSMLLDLLAARTSMTVKEVEDKQKLSTGFLYVAPAGYHLLLESAESFSLDASEKIHHSRPSIDVTFESAANVFGQCVLGVLLSGANADGVDGLQSIVAAGGSTVVQDPATADVDFMPQQAVDAGVAQQIIAPEMMPRFFSDWLRKQG